MVHYPAFLNLREKRCVVVGGGQVALRKVKTLLDCGAEVITISPTFVPELIQLGKGRTIHLFKREYSFGDLEDAFLVVAATDVKEINRKVADEAKKRGVLVNVVDGPEQSDFIVPSFFRRGNLTVAISTGGMSPALSRKIRTRLEKEFGVEYLSLLSIIEEVRSTLRQKGMTVSSETWQKALDLDWLTELVRTGQGKKVKTVLLEVLHRND